MKKNKLIPFKLLPGSWGLSGQVFREAEASYYLKPGEELDRELAKIRYFEDNKDEYNLRIIGIEYKYGHINEFERDKKLAKLENNDKLSYEKALLDIKLKHEMITSYEHDEELLKLDGGLTKEKEIELSFKHKIIDEYTRDIKIAKLTHDEDERTIALLEVEYKHGKIKKNTFEKKRANNSKRTLDWYYRSWF